jgi:CheY-like chemotaxis protein
MAYTIIKWHKGLIKVYSEKGKGTTFIICLPEDASAIKKEAEDKETVVKGHGKILFVDDEDFVRRIAKDILQNSGYEVVTAANGTERIEIYRKNAVYIDLVLLDMSMFGIWGLETFRELITIKPDVKVIMWSGFSMDERVRKALELGADSFIQKPYTNIQLSKAVYNVPVSDRA